MQPGTSNGMRNHLQGTRPKTSRGGSREAIVSQHLEGVLGLVIGADRDRVSHIATVRH